MPELLPEIIMSESLSENIKLSDDQRAALIETPSIEQDPLHDGDLPIHKAAYKGNTSQLASLIPSSTSTINFRGVCYCTPLQLAIRGDHAEAVRILLSAGADATLEDGIEPCYYAPFDAINAAAWLGAQNALTALLAHGLKIPASALQWAASLNHAGCMRTILEMLGRSDFSDGSRREGLMMAVERAALCWHVEAVEIALADVASVPTSDIISPLSFALASATGEFDCDDRCRQYQKPGRQMLVIQQLITAGADVSLKHPRHGRTAFTAALEFCWLQADVVRVLLNNGLKLDQTLEDDRTPLFGVVLNYNDDVSLVGEFLAAGAKATVQDVDLITPLHIAAHRSFAELLTDNGADLFARDRSGKTPLHTACEDGRVDVAGFLLAHGADVDDVSTERQWTPLLHATCMGEGENWFPPIRNRQEQILQLLLAHGTNVHLSAPDGQTALHGAARSGTFDSVKLLIEHGANIHATTSDGETALHSACDMSSPADRNIAIRLAIINILLDHGADIEARDKNGSTALHIAWSRAHLSYGFDCSLFNLLLTRGADRLAKDNEGQTPSDLIDDKEWSWNDEGKVQKRPEPERKRVHDPMSGGRGGRGGRGGIVSQSGRGISGST